MKHIRPDTDYKISSIVNGYFERYHEINKSVEMLSEKMHNPTLSLDEIDTITEELDNNIGELEEITTLLERRGYIHL